MSEQLMMLSFGAEIKNIEIPEGYDIRTLNTADENDISGWIHACDTLWMSFNDTPCTPAEFKELMLDDPEVGADHIFLLFRKSDGVIAGSAAAKIGNDAVLHMVGMAEEFMGQGLSACLNARVMDFMTERGYHRIQLRTDDFRIPAIKGYLKLGFRPWYYMDDMQGRWQSLFEIIKYDPAQYFAYNTTSSRKISI